MGRREAAYGTRRVLVAAVAGGVVAALNLALYATARAQGVAFTARYLGPLSDLTAIAPSMIVVASLVPALVGGLLFAGLAALVVRPARLFVGLAVATALLSLAGPATLADASPATRTALGAMHVVGGLVITGAILVLGRPRDGGQEG